jgi:hypothetical protein
MIGPSAFTIIACVFYFHPGINVMIYAIPVYQVKAQIPAAVLPAGTMLYQPVVAIAYQVRLIGNAGE